MGRYSDWGHVNQGIGFFSVDGGPALLGDVYKLALTAIGTKVGSVTLDLRFGPQGRQFDSDLSIESELVKAELEGIGISLSDVQFGGETVSLSIGGQNFTYTQSQLSTQLVTDIVDQLGEEARVGAEMTADIIWIGMEAFDAVGEALEINSVTMAPRGTFTASFYVVESGIAVSTSGEDSVTLLIDDTTSREYVYFQRENPDDYPPASELQGFVEDNPEMGIGVILEEVFGYTLDGVGVVYVLDGLQEEVQDAFDNSFNFGLGDDGIVDGTDSADVIDSSYTDSDGTSISEGDDIIQAGLGDDIVFGGGGNDLIEGGGDNDTIYAGSGDDTIIYTSGDDVIKGNKSNYGNDTLDLTQYTSDQVSFRIVGYDGECPIFCV